MAEADNKFDQLRTAIEARFHELAPCSVCGIVYTTKGVPCQRCQRRNPEWEEYMADYNERMYEDERELAAQEYHVGVKAPIR